MGILLFYRSLNELYLQRRCEDRQNYVSAPYEVEDGILLIWISMAGDMCDWLKQAVTGVGPRNNKVSIR